MSSRDTAPKKKSRHRVALEPISMEEILGAPGMSGFVSILDPREQVPHLQALVDDIRELSPPKLAPEQAKSAVPQPATDPNSDEPALRRSVNANLIPFQRSTEASPPPAETFEPQERPAVVSAPPNLLEREKITGTERVPEVERDTRPGPVPSRGVVINGHYVRRAVLAQDGHSSGEEVLYQSLWNSRYARQESRETKLVTIGWKAMAKVARLTPRNTKRNCQSLIAKLAIEQLTEENSRESIGRTYRLFSYKAILERRRAGGLEWITRSRGVAFVAAPVDAGTHKQKGPGPERDTGALSSPGSPRVAVPKRDTGDIRGTDAKRDTGYKKDTPTAAACPGMVKLLREYLADVDDSAVAGLVDACRQVAPDATEEEIGYFLRLKADLMLRMGTVKSPMGFLRTAVPRCFEGESFRQYRQAENLRRSAAALEEERRSQEVRRLRQEQQAIADDPNASPDDREFARRYLEVE